MKVTPFLIAIGLFFFQQIAYAQCDSRNCIAVLDVGSSGTRLHVFSYDKDVTNTPIHLQEEGNAKIEPGFATLPATEESVSNYLDSLLQKIAKPNTPIPIYFYATAGMRFFSPSEQEKRYQLVRRYFQMHTEWNLQAAKTLTGKQEATLAWLAVNNELGLLETEAHLVGVLDMGGASTQIAFPITEIGLIHPRYLQTLTLYGRKMTFFAASFLGLGSTEASHQFFNASACFPNHYLLPSGYSAKGDAYLCAKTTGTLLNDIHHVRNIVSSVARREKVQAWYVLGGIVETMDREPFTTEQHTFTSASMLQQANNKICKQNWPDLYQEGQKNRYLYTYCLYPSYYYALIVQGYGISRGKPLHFFSKTRNVDWTSGVVFLQP